MGGHYKDKWHKYKPSDYKPNFIPDYYSKGNNKGSNKRRNSDNSQKPAGCANKHSKFSDNALTIKIPPKDSDEESNK